MLKVGFLWTGKIGTGVVIGRRDDGSWSAPSAIRTGGCGFGAQIGGEVTDAIVIINTTEALKAFSGLGQFCLGGEIAVAVGPVGRSAEGNIRAGDKGMCGCMSYSHSKGLFAGVSLEGSIVYQRKDVNKKFYGTDVQVEELIMGHRERPHAAKPLYDALDGLIN